MNQGQASRDRMLERLSQYAELRDAGMRPADAAEAVGVSQTTRLGYERWYRARIGLPDRRPGFGDVRKVFQ